ncbi:protein iws1 [Anaeramoeba flamelloides]|uniref:Protein iws1 n=1 Tax=Anaeramoeba flamelloides TaxID=1746091 RepID=A0AAV7ZRH4_9EUKA|nr:protein iws1 [Anaeramoeba flamelloides]
MDDAYRQDVQFSHDNQPAIARLQLLPRLFDAIKMIHLQESFLDQGIIGELKRWLEPLPNGARPNNSLKLRCLEIVEQLEIGDYDLVKSGIGKVVRKLSHSKRETQQIKTIASRLVNTWFRQILALSSNYRDFQPTNPESLNEKKTSSSKQLQNKRGEIDDEIIPNNTLNFSGGIEKAVQERNQKKKRRITERNLDHGINHPKMPQRARYNFTKCPKVGILPTEEEQERRRRYHKKQVRLFNRRRSNQNTIKRK